MKLIQRIKTGI